MIHSMTAYGRAEDSNNNNSISCEIRSVNHRYLELSIRLPEELRPIEQKIREQISDKLKRGKIDCNIRIEQHNVHNEMLSINDDLLKKVIGLAEKTNIDLTASSPLNALDLLRWPGVLEKNILDPETINKPLLKLIDQTLDTVIDTRIREGLK